MTPEPDGATATLERAARSESREVAGMDREEITITVDRDLLARAIEVAKTGHVDTVVEFALRDLVFRQTPVEERQAAFDRAAARAREREREFEGEGADGGER